MTARGVFIAGLLVGATTGSVLTAASRTPEPEPVRVPWQVDGDPAGVCEVTGVLVECRTVTPATVAPAVPLEEEP